MIDMLDLDSVAKLCDYKTFALYTKTNLELEYVHIFNRHSTAYTQGLTVQNKTIPKAENQKQKEIAEYQLVCQTDKNK